MPVTIYPAPHHRAEVVHTEGNPQPAREYCSKVEIQPYQSSFKNTFAQPQSDQPSNVIYSAPSGFIHACLKAYFDHHHLVIRPDDIWLAILTQLNFYIRQNAEKLRDRFVAHEGSKNLHILIKGETGNSKNPLDFATFAKQMTQKIQDDVVDPNLKEWAMPDFTTTRETDKVVASIVFMGSMSKYFSFGGSTGCGIPSVTLLGEKKDWETILSRIGKLPSLGDEPRQWHRLLVPVIQRFVKGFDKPDSMANFWQTIVHHVQGGSGQPDRYSGWLNAFIFWNESGDCLMKKHEIQNTLHIGNVIYHQVGTDDVAFGWASVDVKIDDTHNGHGIYMTTMIAGSIGIEFSASGDNEQGADTVTPLSGWLVYEKKMDNGPVVGIERSEKLGDSPVDRAELFQSERKARLQMWAEIEVQ
ncbi:hypothetical protein N431DRAFT_519504 [Stipitochalara longipes BDJ]|nr:hypothetical protein N431DRAFT_519504 [Stipitochalara longipes BDJ]